MQTETRVFKNTVCQTLLKKATAWEKYNNQLCIYTGAGKSAEIISCTVVRPQYIIWNNRTKMNGPDNQVLLLEANNINE